MPNLKDLWQLKPIQTATKSLAAGTVVAGALVGLRAASRAIWGTPEAALKESIDRMPRHLRPLLEELAKIDEDLVDLLGRLMVFRDFAPEAFDSLAEAMLDGAQVRQEAYAAMHDGRMKASEAFRVRRYWQKVIEAVRLFRAVVEQKFETALEDFDEVASDLNAKVEQVCTEAVQDSV